MKSVSTPLLEFITVTLNVMYLTALRTFLLIKSFLTKMISWIAIFFSNSSSTPQSKTRILSLMPITQKDMIKKTKKKPTPAPSLFQPRAGSKLSIKTSPRESSRWSCTMSLKWNLLNRPSRITISFTSSTPKMISTCAAQTLSGNPNRTFFWKREKTKLISVTSLTVFGKSSKLRLLRKNRMKV